MSNSLKTNLKKLPIFQKLILIGSVLMVISVFLPWYSDVDKFKTGDTFWGLTGPLYLIGLIVLLVGGACLGIMILKLMEKPLPKLPMSEHHFHIFASGLALLMLIVASSVYFHTKFGINLTAKNMEIGMILAFAGTIITGVGAVWANKKKDVSFDETGHLEPLINLDKTKERVQGALDEKKPKIDDSVVQTRNREHSQVEPKIDRAATVEEAISASNVEMQKDSFQGALPNIVERKAEENTNDIK